MPTTVDPAEIDRFSALAAEWWNPKGKFRVLHRFNPVRLAYIRAQLLNHFQRDGGGLFPLSGLRILDIGCGGGLIAEPLARLGAQVVGVDASEKNIKTASVHAHEVKLDIDYRVTTAEALANNGETFDVVLALEVIEHVADVPLFVKACAQMVKPQGVMLVSTLNRTLKSFALAIVGAEYVLRWLPRGTHAWSKFLTPDEVRNALLENGLTPLATEGVVYHPLYDTWKLSTDVDVNYMVLAKRP